MRAELAIIYLICINAIVLFRVLPMMLLKGRELSGDVRDALGLIPPAAFAALVANDLLKPDMFEGGLWPGALPLVAALVVTVVARYTKSLIWSALAGLACYALLTFI